MTRSNAKPIRPENKPRIYYHVYDGLGGYWRVRPINTKWTQLRILERDARNKAHTFCSKLNGRRP